MIIQKLQVKQIRGGTNQHCWIQVKPTGGTDECEDVFSGLEAAGKLSWRGEGSKVIFHIADAPCHGKLFHKLGETKDDYFGGDREGRRVEDLLQVLPTAHSQ
jgi:hypothetical protein